MMDPISLILTTITQVWMANAYGRRQLKKAERKRKVEEKSEEEAEKQAVEDFIVQVPCPETATIEHITRFLENEYRIEVLDRYIELAKERQASQPVMDLIVRKRQEIQDFLAKFDKPTLE